MITVKSIYKGGVKENIQGNQQGSRHWGTRTKSFLERKKNFLSKLA